MTITAKYKFLEIRTTNPIRNPIMFELSDEYRTNTEMREMAQEVVEERFGKEQLWYWVGHF